MMASCVPVMARGEHSPTEPARERSLRMTTASVSRQQEDPTAGVSKPPDGRSLDGALNQEPGFTSDKTLEAEIKIFHDDCKHRYKFNTRWDNTLNALGILLSIAIVAAGVFKQSETSAILGALVAAIVTAQRAFPFGQRAIFYRTLIGQIENLQTDVTQYTINKHDAVLMMKSLRLDYAQQLPRGASFRPAEEHAVNIGSSSGLPTTPVLSDKRTSACTISNEHTS